MANETIGIAPEAPPEGCTICGGPATLHVCVPVVVNMLKQDPGFRDMIAEVVRGQNNPMKVVGDPVEPDFSFVVGEEPKAGRENEFDAAVSKAIGDSLKSAVENVVEKTMANDEALQNQEEPLEPLEPLEPDAYQPEINQKGDALILMSKYVPYTSNREQGRAFREMVLKPCMDDAPGLINIDFAGATDCDSGFLDELFGGLVKEQGIEAMTRCNLVAKEDPSLLREIESYVSKAYGAHTLSSV